ncbi:unnamed protein product [Protopolystoma xenopodis]|uniref:Uncharacterized protein n=1 Tax=Protopolystoma xenopodis TaxID=117903 RepID=A0A3S5CDU5_9PLAT|nr:unnamed protein product [Protopolystoma xenopodis]
MRENSGNLTIQSSFISLSLSLSPSPFYQFDVYLAATFSLFSVSLRPLRCVINTQPTYPTQARIAQAPITATERMHINPHKAEDRLS